MPLETSAIAKLLREFAGRIELAEGSPYKARAYSRAAENLLALASPIDELIANRELRRIPGVGEAIAEKIETLHRTGTHPTLEKLRKELPATVLDMLRVPGLAPKKIRLLYDELGIATLEDLERAARENKLAAVKGIGASLQDKIVSGIAMMQSAKGQRHLHRADELMQEAALDLERLHPELQKIVAAGDLRRGSELVSDLCLVALGPEPGYRAIAVNEEITLHVTDRRRYGATLIAATGSAEHLAALQQLAAQKDMTLDAEGLRHGTRLVACADETKVYATLGLPYIEPELREGRGEIDLALAHRLPRLVTDRDLRGLVHCHTNRSDGVNTLSQMAEAARERGYEYFGVADHSQSAGYAGGLSIDEIFEQHAEADRLNEGYGPGFRILKGIESDILADGALDYPDEILASFDYVVASVHSRFRLDEAAQTARIVKAVGNPHTTILGHMTGRMLLRREGYELDIPHVLEACAQHGVAVEINANPHRLDLDWRWHGLALELGCLFSINPDAHSTGELDLTHWGVLMARKGGIPKERIINTRGLRAMSEFLAAKRQAQKPSPAPKPKPKLKPKLKPTRPRG